LRVQGRLKTDAPPFLMLGLNVENTTSSDFRVTAAARYLAFDTIGSGSELRVDGAAGSDPAFGVQLYRPIGLTPFFVAPYADVGRITFNFVDYRRCSSPTRPRLRPSDRLLLRIIVVISDVGRCNRPATNRRTNRLVS
jgi:hypothetical protein